MRRFLAELLRCPWCCGRLDADVFLAAGEEQARRILEGVLRCSCGRSFPIINGIPRMLEDAYVLFPEFATRYADRLHLTDGSGAEAAGGRRERLIARTRERFGYQWTTFSEMSCDFSQNFWNYLSPATPELLHGKVGLDVGCGFGRHLYHAARYCAEVVGVDLSQAVESAAHNTRDLPNVHLVQADLYALPFPPQRFDLIYSIGVLHHVPDPAAGLAKLVPLLREDGRLFVWLYSKRRWMLNALLECSRAVTTRCPHGVVKQLAFLGALIDVGLFIGPYRRLRAVPAFGRWVERLTPARLKLYSAYPFQVMYADWFDRLAAPIRYYYNEREVRELLEHVGIVDITVSPTGLYGWRACGAKHNGNEDLV